jgi:hypothetical protein
MAGRGTEGKTYRKEEKEKSINGKTIDSRKKDMRRRRNKETWEE